MQDLDDTDLNILRLLLEDARRPYSEIADRVGVSPPTVSDRVDRLQKLGVIRQFTLDVDRTALADGVPVLLEVRLRPGADDRVADRLAAAGPVERVYETADRRLMVEATVENGDARDLLRDAIDLEFVADYEVHMLSSATWEPRLAGPDIRMEFEDEAEVPGAVDRN